MQECCSSLNPAPTLAQTMNESSSRRRSRSAKPPRSLRAEQRPDDDRAENPVNRQLSDRVKQAQADMKQNPSQRKPPRPLLPHQKPHPANCPRKLRQFDG